MDDIGRFFARYAERYMASDVDAVGAMYDAPMVAVREGRAMHLPDANAVREHLVGLMAAYAQSGATRADVAQIDPVPLGRSSAMVTVDWHVRDAAGCILKDFRTTYHILRRDEGWRILSYTNHD